MAWTHTKDGEAKTVTEGKQTVGGPVVEVIIINLVDEGTAAGATREPKVRQHGNVYTVSA